MNRFIFLAIAIFSFHSGNGQPPTFPVYYSPVTMPSSLKNNYYGLFDTRLLAEDLASLLQKATKQTFLPSAGQGQTSKGIYLILDSNNISLGNEEGILESDGKNFIRITARYSTGISYTMYSWLEELGFHFYLPGNEWTIIPDLKDIFSAKIDKRHYKPFFHVRSFGASGGIFPIKGLDETGQNEKEWRTWYQRNRMGCDYIRIDGHVGEAFNISHRKEIENDSLIVAPANGKRNYRQSAKLDPTYKKGVALFSDWIVEAFKKEQSILPSFLPFKKYYSADAGDGLEYCHTPECERQFKTVPDQAFSIVNETARKIRKVNPDAGVSTLAYTERADTPGIRIEPNVHVMVVASAFQSVGTDAELMKRWSIKSKTISLYDYLNIGVWAYDKPFFNMYRYYHYMQYLRSLKTEGIHFETSLSKFGSGIQQYFILRFLCKPYASVDDVLDEFCKNNFGEAANPMKALLKEWYFSDVHLFTNLDYPSFYEDELGRFVKYILAAENHTGLSKEIRARINELKAYIIYLCKYYELYADLNSLQEIGTNPNLRNEKTEELLNYIWQQYPSKIFHNTQLSDLFKNALTEPQKEKWNYAKSDHFKGITDSASEKMKKAFELVKEKYLPLASQQYVITDSFLLSNVRFSADSINMSTTDEKGVPNFIYPISFYCAAPGILKIRYQIDSSQVKNKSGSVAMVSIESDDYSFIKTYPIYHEGSNGTISCQLPVKGHYRLFLSQFNATHISYIIYPGKNLFYHNKKSILANCIIMQFAGQNSIYPNRYMAFPAPQDDSIRFRNMYVDSKNTSRFYSQSGIQIPIKENTKLFYNTAAIPKSLHGQFIFYENPTFRWPPIFINTTPWQFFLKYPLNGQSH